MQHVAKILRKEGMRGYSVDVGVIPIVERDQEGKVIRKQLEVDFVCNLGSYRYYIQSAYSLPDEAKRAQEIRPFRKIDDSFKKIVITKDIVSPYYDDYGILTVNIYDFLLEPQILENRQCKRNNLYFKVERHLQSSTDINYRKESLAEGVFENLSETIDLERRGRISSSVTGR